MASATTKTPETVDEIRRSMAQIRQRLHQDMQGVVAGAEAASDWKHYVRLYPFACLAVAFGLGMVVVPRRRRSVSKTAEKAAEAVLAKVSGAAEAVQNGSAIPFKGDTPKEKEKEKKAGLLGIAFGLVSPLLVRAAQSYALNYVESWIAQQAAASGMTASPGGPPPGEGAGATR